MNNIVIFAGRVGQAPYMKTFGNSENEVAKFSVAVDTFSKDENAEPMWIDCDAWNGLSDRVMKIVTKGRDIMVQGRLQINVIPAKDDKPEIHKPVLNLTGFHVFGKKPAGETITLPEAADEAKPAAAKKPSRK